MVTNIYFKIPRRVRILLIFIVIMLAVLFVLRFLPAETRNVPQDFLKARQEASGIAGEIAQLSDDSVKKLEEISRLDSDHNYTDALFMVSAELEKNKQARDKGIELALRLEIMAKNLAQISPSSAGQIALEAISSETALISRLINYNDYLNQLLEILRNKFLGQGDGNKVQELVGKINDEAVAINDLNQKFNDLMLEFDSR